MAPLARSVLLPQCASCLRRFTRLGLEPWRPLEQQPVRALSKAARKAENTVVVQLLQDVKKFGRKGSYIPINPSLMRNKWFPMRFANYVPHDKLKQLKSENTLIQRDFEFGVKRPLAEGENTAEDTEQQHYVRPVEIKLLSPERSMELLDIFVPHHIDFLRQAKEQEHAGERFGSSAADVLSAAAGQSQASGIYGSVSTEDVASTIRQALAHNDEAARVILLDKDVRFVEEHEGDASRIKQLGEFKVEIKISGAAEPLVRTVRVRAKPKDE